MDYNLSYLQGVLLMNVQAFRAATGHFGKSESFKDIECFMNVIKTFN